MKISCLAVKNDKDVFDNVYTFAMTEIFGKKSGKNYFQVQTVLQFSIAFWCANSLYGT